MVHPGFILSLGISMEEKEETKYAPDNRERCETKDCPNPKQEGGKCFACQVIEKENENT